MSGSLAPVINPDDLWMGDEGPSPLEISSRSEESHDQQVQISLKTFGESLRAAAKAVFPRESTSRYSKVFVLVIGWHQNEATRNLFNVFQDVYHFEVEWWEIPKDVSSEEVGQKISKFVNLGGDSEDHLKILFYSGHSQVDHSKRVLWIRSVPIKLPRKIAN